MLLRQGRALPEKPGLPGWEGPSTPNPKRFVVLCKNSAQGDICWPPHTSLIHPDPDTKWRPSSLRASRIQTPLLNASPPSPSSPPRWSNLTIGRPRVPTCVRRTCVRRTCVRRTCVRRTCVRSRLSRVPRLVTLPTVASQAPVHGMFHRSGRPCSPPGDFLNPGLSRLLSCQVGSLPLAPPGKPRQS